MPREKTISCAWKGLKIFLRLYQITLPPPPQKLNGPPLICNRPFPSCLLPLFQNESWVWSACKWTCEWNSFSYKRFCPRYNKLIFPVPWHFDISGFHCILRFIFSTSKPFFSCSRTFWCVYFTPRLFLLLLLITVFFPFSVIYMWLAIPSQVTNVEERGRVKCHQYWPTKGGEAYGDIQVTLTQTVELSDFTVRTLCLKKANSRSERTLNQYHYTIWPDHGVPTCATSVLTFVRKASGANPPDAGPMVRMYRQIS